MERRSDGDAREVEEGSRRRREGGGGGGGAGGVRMCQEPEDG